MKIKLFEDYNQDDENMGFKESIDDCVSSSQRCVDEFEEESDHMDMIDSCLECIILAQAVKELIDSDSKLLKSLCQVFKLSISSCIEQCKKFDSDASVSCIEACKRCEIDCDVVISEWLYGYIINIVNSKEINNFTFHIII